jgi:hypothetical protein
MHTSNIHALSGIRTHGPGFRANEDSAWLRPLGYRDRIIPIQIYYPNNAGEVAGFWWGRSKVQVLCEEAVGLKIGQIMYV